MRVMWSCEAKTIALGIEKKTIDDREYSMGEAGNYPLYGILTAMIDGRRCK